MILDQIRLRESPASCAGLVETMASARVFGKDIAVALEWLAGGWVGGLVGGSGEIKQTLIQLEARALPRFAFV